MNRQPVQSTSLSSVGYDDATSRMEVEFADGTVYLYYLVPKQVYRNLVEADSHGRYFAENIRDRFQPARLK